MNWALANLSALLGYPASSARSQHDCRYTSIGPSEINDCFNLQTEWCNLRNCSENAGLEAENRAIKTVFENYEYLGVTGGAVYVDDKLEAFTTTEPLNRRHCRHPFRKSQPRDRRAVPGHQPMVLSKKR